MDPSLALRALFGRRLPRRVRSERESEREAFFVASRFIAIIVIIAIKTPLRSTVHTQLKMRLLRWRDKAGRKAERVALGTE